MPFQSPRATPLRWPAWEPSLPVFCDPRPTPVPALRPIRAYIYALRRSCVGLLEDLFSRARNLHQSGRRVRQGFMEQLERVRGAIFAEGAAHHGPKSPERAKTF